jgi:hypothetical protein
MKTQVINITPAIAADMLRKNTHNRPLDLKLVRQYMGHILNGQWQLTHQGIGISESDVLLDGQNRLTAIVQAKKTVPMMVTTGLPDTTMTVLDMGKKRSVGDMFALLEVSDAYNIASVIAKYWRFKQGLTAERGSMRDGEAMSVQERYDFYLEHSKLVTKALSIGRECYKKAKFFTVSDIAAMILYLNLERKHGVQRVADFFYEVHMVGDAVQTPATRALFTVLLRYLTGREKLQYKAKIALTAKAWNFWRNGADVRLLKYDPEREEYPEFK